MHAAEQDERIGEVLKERYEILSELGQGGQGRTYLGNDRQRGVKVAIKELHLTRMMSWKMLELFEREGRVLEGLSHPQIPAYVDSFRFEKNGQMRFFLVQEFVAGEDLESLVEGGLRTDTEQATAFIDEMLGILEYLHGLSPPVVHRDIKPSNIIRREVDGRWVLIDFGAVQHAEEMADEGGGRSTTVGTTGYMAPEQLMGRSVAATDLYGLGATVVTMLSHRHPADLPMDGLRLDFEPFVNVSQELRAFIAQMLNPYADERFPSAAVARRKLHGEAVEAPVVGGNAPEKDGWGARDVTFGRTVVRDNVEEVRATWEEERRLLEVREKAIRAPDALARQRAAALAKPDPLDFRGTLERTDDGLLIRLRPRQKPWRKPLAMATLGGMFLVAPSIESLGTAGVLFLLFVGICSVLPGVLWLIYEFLLWVRLETIQIQGGVLRYDKGGISGRSSRVVLPVSSIRSVKMGTGRDLREVGRLSKEVVDFGDVDEIFVSTGGGPQFSFGNGLSLEEQGYVVREMLKAMGA